MVGAVAWVGLTPRGRGTGGKLRSGGISKQGDRTLRSLLIDGASSYLRQRSSVASRIRGSAICSRVNPTKVLWWRSQPRMHASPGPCSPREKVSRTRPRAGRRLIAAGTGALTVGKGKYGVTANGQEPGSRHSAWSSRAIARRNDWSSIGDIHQGQRSIALQGVYITALGQSAEAPKSPCRKGPSIHDRGRRASSGVEAGSRRSTTTSPGRGIPSTGNTSNSSWSCCR